MGPKVNQKPHRESIMAFNISRSRISEHVLNMYGLVRLVEEKGFSDAVRYVYALMSKYLRYEYKELNPGVSFGSECIAVKKENERWKAEVPRVALVGHAVAASVLEQ
jgi:hypothetical protein